MSRNNRLTREIKKLACVAATIGLVAMNCSPALASTVTKQTTTTTTTTTTISEDDPATTGEPLTTPNPEGTYSAHFTPVSKPSAQPETQAPAPQTVVAIPAKVMVLKFRGPMEVSMETDLGYKVKSGQLSEYQDDFDVLGLDMQKAIVAALRTKLGTDAVQAVSTATPNPGDEDANQKLNNMKSRFVLKGTIDKVRFEGNTLIPNYYELTMSAQLVSTADPGQVVWSMRHKLFARLYHTEGDKPPAQTFGERMAPHIAEQIAVPISTAANSN